MISLLPFTQQASAQFADDFSDGEFTSNPAWMGDTLRFTSSGMELRLQAPAATGSAFLSTPSKSINNATWEFVARMDFNPSGSNYSRIYLVSNIENLSGNPDGYFVQVGSTDDDICLYKQTGTVITRIIDGENGRLDQNAVSVFAKVIRDDAGNWQLLTGSGSDNLILEGTGFDATHVVSSYFGVRCVYTSTRSNDFHFDNFLVSGEVIRDQTPPQLLSLTVTSQQELYLEFSEPVLKPSANSFSTQADDNELNIDEVKISDDQRKVLVRFASSFQNGMSYELRITDIFDLSGNKIVPIRQTFLFLEPVEPQPKDIIITEIFPDPSPANGLPEEEFVEIYNRSTHPFDLANWVLTDGSSSASLPAMLILPGEYLILTQQDATEKFVAYGKVIGLLGFPSLNNASDAIILLSAGKIQIDAVSYSDSWYRDSVKKSGGWSIELIDPENTCAVGDNWAASESITGGSPGERNSVYANKPDLTGPELLSAIPISNLRIVLKFSEALEKTVPDADQFLITPALAVSTVSFVDESLNALQIDLLEDINPETKYTIKLISVRDCAGNETSPDRDVIVFGLPQQAVPGDVVINEILFNPRPTGVDFVEIFNASKKFIDLQGWVLGNLENDLPTNPREISAGNVLLSPGGYMTLTSDGNVLKGEYVHAREDNFLQMSLPSLSDDEGAVAMMSQDNVVIDKFQYFDDYHSPFLKDDEGVSLERISATTPTMDPRNWKSASSTTGFATPGYLNSNSRPEVSKRESVFVEPEVFDPDGSPSFVMIRYQFDQPGMVTNIKIIDANGRVVKELANNELIGTAGFFSWDGDTSMGYAARVGYYMLWMNVVDASGKTDTFRKRIAIAGRF